MTIRVLLATNCAGLPPLTREGLTQLYAAHPELFGHPDEVANFDDMAGREHTNLEDEFENCFVQGDKVYFLTMTDPEFRTSAWLLQRFDEDTLRSLLRPPMPSTLKLKTVEIPSDVDWFLDTDNTGSEFVRERARTWS